MTNKIRIIGKKDCIFDKVREQINDAILFDGDNLHEIVHIIIDIMREKHGAIDLSISGGSRFVMFDTKLKGACYFPFVMVKGRYLIYNKNQLKLLPDENDSIWRHFDVYEDVIPVDKKDDDNDQ